MNPLHSITSTGRHPLFWIVALAFGLRLYAYLTLGIVNPDAAHYINQAKAIYFGDWQSFMQCSGFPYLTLFPVLIAGVFPITHDWIAAGQLINLVCGTGLLFPIYLITRRFFEPAVTHATTLVFALVPTYVSLSGDLLRDPLFWVLLCLGMLLFLRQWDARAQPGRFRYDLVLSGGCFLLSTLTRIEGVTLLSASALFLLISSSDRKIERLFFFLSPLLVFGGLVLITMVISGIPASRLLRIDALGHESTQFIQQYQTLRSHLQGMIAQHDMPTSEFLRHIRKIAWLIPLGIILNAIIEGFFYIFTLIYVLGWVGIRQRIRQDWRIGYFICLTVVGITVLYLHMLRTWFMYHRFLSIVFFPGCIFFGFGLDHIVRTLRSKFRFKANVAITLIVVVFLLISVPKNLRPKEADKVIYRRAAAIIAESKSPKKIARLAAIQDTTYEWIFFYAHIDYPGMLCWQELIIDIPDSYTELVERLEEADARYVIYKEENWPKERFDLLNSPYESDFRIAGQWYTDKQQTVVLFERIRSVTGSENG